MMMSDKAPTYFISHGGGPWPWLPPLRDHMTKLEASLVDMVASWAEPPKAILMVSGHWEETGAIGVMSSPNPPMLYDYSGFPKEMYEISYPAPGAPAFASRAYDLLKAAGISAKLDPQRGFDHGAFAPMAAMYPKADMPIFEISLDASYDPMAHVEIGRALAPLRAEGVMIIGSGLSFHNLRIMDKRGAKPSQEFDKWLAETLVLPPAERLAALIDWEKAPAARLAHKEEDHLLPIFVALGAAENEEVSRVYHETDFGGFITASSYRFG